MNNCLIVAVFLRGSLGGCAGGRLLAPAAAEARASRAATAPPDSPRVARVDTSRQPIHTNQVVWFLSITFYNYPFCFFFHGKYSLSTPYLLESGGRVERDSSSVRRPTKNLVLCPVHLHHTHLVLYISWQKDTRNSNFFYGVSILLLEAHFVSYLYFFFISILPSFLFLTFPS